jgi:3-hydroxyisobutyrate dehydrogenase-like beta-hydroxyacid dehydrogenase
MAVAVLALGYDGLYLDANAVAPSTMRELAALFRGAAGGARLVDGGLIGPPAQTSGTTRLYLSGPDAPAFAPCFREGALAATPVEGPLGAASALKMSYAAWTKGSAALLAAVVAVAEEEQVAGPLREEWRLSQPQLVERADLGLRGTARKAWRFEGEMLEIARTFAEAGLPAGFHEAAAEVYRRLAPFKEADPLPPDQALRRAVRQRRG